VEAIDGMAPKARSGNYTPSVASIYTSCPLELDVTTMQPPLIVGERTNTNGSKKFKDLLQAEDIDGMVSMAREQEKKALIYSMSVLLMWAATKSKTCMALCKGSMSN
jgi:5-methyltetrahydrofolate--homocysteine methyltransferase